MSEEQCKSGISFEILKKDGPTPCCCCKKKESHTTCCQGGCKHYRCHTSENSHNGFTLVELLVVITIIGILISLLLPAVQASREAANRIQCGSNIRQLSIAIQNYVDVHNSLPVLDYGIDANDRDSGFSTIVALCPYMEQMALSESITNYVHKNGLTNLAVSATFISIVLRQPFLSKYCIST